MNVTSVSLLQHSSPEGQANHGFAREDSGGTRVRQIRDAWNGSPGDYVALVPSVRSTAWTDVSAVFRKTVRVGNNRSGVQTLRI